MKKSQSFGWMLIIMIGIYLLSAAGTHAQDNEAFIQGKWRVSGQLPPNQSGHSMSWFQEWTFSDGKFLEEGYPPLGQKGKYRIIRNEDDKLTLELFEQSGTFGTENSRLEIVIDKKENTLKIGQNAGFKRIPKAQERGKQ